MRTQVSRLSRIKATYTRFYCPAGAYNRRSPNTCERKKSTSELKEGVASIASILNKHGKGTPYFGTLNNGDVIGQQVSDTTLREISQVVAHSRETPVYPTIERLVSDDDKAYVRVAFEGQDAPYACKNAYRIRVADEDRSMEPDKLEAMMLERAYRKRPWDAQLSPRPLSDVDEDTLRKFVERGRERGRIKFEYTDVEDVLSRLGLYRNGQMLNAADVIFCPSEKTQLKMGVFVDHRRTEVLDMQHESGTLFELIDAAELYILNNIRRRYEQIDFGTKLTFHRNDPYSERELGTVKVPSGSKWFQDVGAKQRLSENEETVLAFLGQRESATAVEISDAIGISRRGVTKLMGRLPTQSSWNPSDRRGREGTACCNWNMLMASRHQSRAEASNSHRCLRNTARPRPHRLSAYRSQCVPETFRKARGRGERRYVVICHALSCSSVVADDFPFKEK